MLRPARRRAERGAGPGGQAAARWPQHVLAALVLLAMLCAEQTATAAEAPVVAWVSPHALDVWYEVEDAGERRRGAPAHAAAREAAQEATGSAQATSRAEHIPEVETVTPHANSAPVAVTTPARLVPGVEIARPHANSGPPAVASRAPLVPQVERWRPLVLSVSRLVAKVAGQPLDPELLLALISTESGGDPRATSPGAAGGLLQVGAPAFADMVERYPSLFVKRDRYDPEENLLGGALYLLYCARYIGADLHTPAGLRAALHAYNLGPEAVRVLLREGPQLGGGELLVNWRALPVETFLHAERTLRAYGN